MEKRLTRSNNRIVSGVAGGIADYLQLDPLVVRILFILFSVGFGTGLVVYMLLWIITPKQDAPHARLNEHRSATTDYVLDQSTSTYTNPNTAMSSETKAPNNYLGGIILIGIGTLFLLRNVFDIDWDQFWPVIRILIGVSLIARSRKKEIEEPVRLLPKTASPSIAESNYTSTVTTAPASTDATKPSPTEASNTPPLAPPISEPRPSVEE